LFRQKLFLEIGGRITFFSPCQRAPQVRPFCHEGDFAEVLLMIGLDPELSTVNQTATNRIKKLAINDPARLMSPLRPGVGKVQVKAPNCVSRQHVPDGIVDFRPQNAKVREPGSDASATSFPNSSQKTFDTEKISLGKFLRRFN
jgi:hypothetical protein